MAFDYAAHEAQMAAEILQDVREASARFQILIADISSNFRRPQSWERLKRDVNNLSLLCSGMDNRLLELLMHRFSNYLAYVDEPSQSQIDDFGVFVDVMGALASGEIPADGDPAEFVRSLPVHRPVDLDDVEHLHIEVLVVDSQKTGARYVTRELQNCGFRVATASGSADAVALAARTRPDLIMTSAMLDEIDGIELIRMLAIPMATKDIPIAVLTSFDMDNERLRDMPGHAAVLRKGEHFSDDLVKALEKIGLA